MKRLKISPGDPQWLIIKGYCEHRLQKLREENDASDTLERTEKLRGMIEFAKEILELESKAELVRVVDENYID